MGKKRLGREAWDRICAAVADDSGEMAFADGGIWTAKKLFALCCYLEQFTRGMHGNPRFRAGITYLDLFAGSGLCRVTTDGRVRNYPGSAVIAAAISESKPFDRLLLVEADPLKLSACVERVHATGFRGELRTWSGDCNQLVGSVREAMPAGSLTVAFVDPYSLGIHFSTIRQLVRMRAVDLMILFADAIDIVRNVEEYYLPHEQSKLDEMLGESSGWREDWSRLTSRNGGSVRQMFADIYARQLAKLGYTHSKSWPLDGPHGPLYRLVYASKHERGLQFCEIAVNEDFEGNAGLFGRM